METLVAELLGVCVMLADEAGDIVRGVAEGGHLGQVRDKSAPAAAPSAAPPAKKEEAKALDPQTQADRRAERLIVAALSRRFGSAAGRCAPCIRSTRGFVFKSSGFKSLLKKIRFSRIVRVSRKSGFPNVRFTWSTSPFYWSIHWSIGPFYWSIGPFIHSFIHFTRLVYTNLRRYPAVTVLGEEALEGALVAAGGVNADGTVVGRCKLCTRSVRSPPSWL